MPIDPSEIEQLKKEIDLASYITSRGIALSKSGRNHQGLCPFHQETSPSFTVNPDENLWHCFGCGSGGDIFSFVERLDKVGFTEAVGRVKRGLSKIPVGAALCGRPSLPDDNGRTQGSPLRPAHQKLLNRIIQFYQQELWKDRRGLDYLKSRGITDKQSLIDFGAGFVAGNLPEMLPADGEYEVALKQIGILNSNGHELFYGCVVFPLLDFNNNAVGLYGRRIAADEQVSHLYLPGPRRGLINRQAAKRSKTLLLTEAIIDSLTLHANGFKNSIPMYGVNGWTEDHTKLFKEYPPENLYLCFDNDDGGYQGALTVKEKMLALREEGVSRIKTPMVRLTGVKDINDYFKKYRPEEFEALLKQANPQSVETSEVHHVREERFYETTEHGFFVAYGKREYEIKGIAKQGTQLKVTIKASLDIKGNDRSAASRFQITTIDLYSIRSKEWFAKVVAELTGERLELALEDLNRIINRIENRRGEPLCSPVKKALTEEEKKAALAFLKSPNLLQDILDDLETLGCTGEETNKLVAYLVAISRKMEEPLSLLIQSRSAAGKSTLQDAILALVPEEDFIKYTRLTDQALFYKGEDSLKNKILAIEEAAGLGGSAYSIRAMQSSKQLTVATTSKDPATGKMKTEEYKVNGPLAIMLTTTAIDLDAEMESRFLNLAIDESSKMTGQIHLKQREQETLEGYLAKKESNHALLKHQNAQRLLKPLVVVNPYAPYLNFSTENLRSRRDHKKYLNLMKAIAFLHQHQREVKTATVGAALCGRPQQTIEYIEVTLKDIEQANLMAHEVLGKSLDDLSVSSRTLLNLIHQMVSDMMKKAGVDPSTRQPMADSLRAGFSFNRRLIREYAKWSDWQVKTHIHELEELGFIYSRMGSKGKEYVYELHHEVPKESAKKVYLGLTPVSQLEKMLPNLEGRKFNLVG